MATKATRSMPANLPICCVSMISSRYTTARPAYHAAGTSPKLSDHRQRSFPSHESPESAVSQLVRWFLRRSGSRVSISIACRRPKCRWHLASVKSLCPFGQPEKALGHEPQIDPWLPPYNHQACQFQRPIGVVAAEEDASLLRCNHSGLQHQTSFVVRGAGCRKSKPRHLAEGEKCS